MGPDKIIWGTDYAGFGAQIRTAVRACASSRSRRTCRRITAYPAITDEDRAKIFGGNLGRLLGIDTSKRRIKAQL